MAKRYYGKSGAMISKDMTKQANLPQDVIMRPFGMGGYTMPEGLDDTIKGIDKQIGGDMSQMKKAMKGHNSKY